MKKRVFKRKIYDKILQWKQESKGKSALMIQGARRIGKSTIVEEFAKNEYTSHLIIDFNRASPTVKSLFDDLMDLDFIFLQLQTIYNVALVKRKSVIIFDEVQKCPNARQAIKYLVQDGRYDYIETGSLISIKQNTKGITIPSEEEQIDMYPMDFEEFRWALPSAAWKIFRAEATICLKFAVLTYFQAKLRRLSSRFRSLVHTMKLFLSARAILTN